MYFPTDSASISVVESCYERLKEVVLRNRLLFLLNEVKLMIYNHRKLVFEPEWTRIRPSLKQKSIIDYIITDAQ